MGDEIILSRVGLPTDAVTRVEVIGDSGRHLVLRNVADVTVALQDEGRTLKVFLHRATEEKPNAGQ